MKASERKMNELRADMIARGFADLANSPFINSIGIIVGAGDKLKKHIQKEATK